MRIPVVGRLFPWILAIVLVFPGILGAQQAQEGEKLFRQNCSACHKLGTKLIGPDLVGISDRRPVEWIVKFVQNSQEVIKSGDPYAVKLFEEYNKVVMPPQGLTEEQVKSIIAYIDEYAKGGGESAAAGEAGAAFVVDAPELNPLQWTIIFTLLTILLVVIAKTLEWAYRAKGNEFSWKQITPYFFIAWGIFWAAFVGWQLVTYTKDIRIMDASYEGKEIKWLFDITWISTVVIYFVVHFFLFLFLFRYRGGKGNKAYYYAHNNKLEIFWTVATAIPLVVMIIYSMTVWQRVMAEPNKADHEVEVFAYQFGWKFRYPGPDGKLGQYNYRLIDPVNNPLGLDFNDPAAKDDIIVDELYLAKDRTFRFRLRSRDVIHSAWFVHFNMQLYVQPGMKNSLTFTPRLTTDEARAQLGNPEFNFELACNQICGSAHFNMKRYIYVLTPADFDQWLGQQQSFYSQVKGQLNSQTASLTQSNF